MLDWVDGWQRLHDPSHVRRRTVAEWRAQVHATGFVTDARDGCAPIDLEFAWWTETSGCSADAMNALRAHARSASEEVRHS